jgi:hypothetical protein
MADDFGVDLEEVYRVIETSEVLIVRFHMIGKRLLVDFRTGPGTQPLVAVVPRAESVEDRFRSIKKMRPDLPFPEKVMSFHWPRSLPVFLGSGAWERIAERARSLGSDDTSAQCKRCADELLDEERREVQAAIGGSGHYQTLWERQRA